MPSSSAELRTPLPPRLRTWVYTIVLLRSLSSPSVKVAAGGGGWLVAYTGLPEFFGDEVDDALPGLEGPC